MLAQAIDTEIAVETEDEKRHQPGNEHQDDDEATPRQGLCYHSPLPPLYCFQKKVVGCEIAGVLASGLLNWRAGTFPRPVFAMRTPAAAGDNPTRPTLHCSSITIFQISCPSRVRSSSGALNALAYSS